MHVAARVRQAIGTTEAMLRAADAGDWQDVAVLEQIRASELGALLAGEGGTPPRELLMRLAELNARLQRMASARRDDLGERTRSLRRGDRAARAYNQAAR